MIKHENYEPAGKAIENEDDIKNLLYTRAQIYMHI